MLLMVSGARLHLEKSSACLKFIIGGQRWEVGQRDWGTAHPIWGKTLVITDIRHEQTAPRESAGVCSC